MTPTMTNRGGGGEFNEERENRARGEVGRLGTGSTGHELAIYREGEEQRERRGEEWRCRCH